MKILFNTNKTNPHRNIFFVMPDLSPGRHFFELLNIFCFCASKNPMIKSSSDVLVPASHAFRLKLNHDKKKTLLHATSIMSPPPSNLVLKRFKRIDSQILCSARVA